MNKKVAVAPLEYRTGGRERMSSDEKWIVAGQNLVRQLSRLLARDGGALDPSTRILDLGCGPGRLLTGLQSLGMEYGEFVGVDVQQRYIDWLSKNMADDKTTFLRLDMHNARYNPGGQRVDDVSLAIPNKHFDVAVLYSVFTHMLIDDIELFLRVLYRHLAPGGRALVTTWVEDGVPLQTENPVDWHLEHTGPLHRVLIEKKAFEDRVRQAGLEIRDFRQRRGRHHQYAKGQPTYLLARPEL